MTDNTEKTLYVFKSKGEDEPSFVLVSSSPDEKVCQHIVKRLELAEAEAMSIAEIEQTYGIERSRLLCEMERGGFLSIKLETTLTHNE